MEKGILDKIKIYCDNSDEKHKITINTTQLDDLNFLTKEFFLKNPIIYDDSKIWWKWDNHDMKWYKVDETDITISFNGVFNLIDVRTTHLSSAKTMILNAIRNCARIFIKEFVQPVKDTWIVFKDIIIDIENNKQFPNTFEYFSLNSLPYNYLDSTDTSTPTIDGYFKDWVGTTPDGLDWTTTLKEMFAYCMLPSYPLEITFALHGSGSNGKSTCLDLLAKFIGEDNYTSNSLSALSNPNNRFATSGLHGKLACIMGEIDDTIIKSTKLLKELVSGKDPISAEFKGTKSFKFINYAKIIMATNNIPMTVDLSDAYYRRWIIIDFLKKFEPKGNINKQISNYELSNFARQLVFILKELLQKCKFTNEGSLLNKKNRYEQRSNPIQGFMDEFCVKDHNSLIPVFEFYDNLDPYLVNRNYKKLSKKAVTQFMKQHLGVESKLHRIDENKNPWRCYEGIKWKDEKKIPNTIFNKESNIFENIDIINIKNLDDRLYTLDEIYEKFKSYTKDEVNDKIKKLKKIGDVCEIKSGIYRFKSGVL